MFKQNDNTLSFLCYVFCMNRSDRSYKKEVKQVLQTMDDVVAGYSGGETQRSDLDPPFKQPADNADTTPMSSPLIPPPPPPPPLPPPPPGCSSFSPYRVVYKKENSKNKTQNKPSFKYVVD